MAVRRSREEREIEYRRQCVKDAWIKLGAFDVTQQQIADALKADYRIVVDRSTVSRDLTAIKKTMREQTPEDLRAFLLAEFLFVIREARSAWLRSLQDAETTIQEAIEGEGSSGTKRLKASTKKEGQSGNPAHLAQFQAALRSIWEIVGLTDTERRIEELERRYGEKRMPNEPL